MCYHGGKVISNYVVNDIIIKHFIRLKENKLKYIISNIIEYILKPNENNIKAEEIT